MDWYLPISDFKNGSETIVVDVNGSDLPNELGTDRFEYKVKPGLKVEVEEPTFYAPTGAPPSKGTGGGAPAGPDKDNRTAQNVYSIVCGPDSGATIYGEGSNKVNGTYTLVAVPNKGKACNWFIHQVTVKDSDVTDCNLSCEPDNNVPTSDGETIVPDPVPDEPDPDTPDDDTYCINVTVTGESDQCTVSGDGCGKTKGLYTVTVSSKDPSNYSPEWSSKKYTIVDKDISDTVSCDKIEPGESCYKITVQGSAEEKANCPVTLPAGNCPEGNEGGPYKSGTHTVVVTPKDGYMFNNSAEASDVKVTIVDKDGVVDLTGKCVPANAPAKVCFLPMFMPCMAAYPNTTGGINMITGARWSLSVNADGVHESINQTTGGQDGNLLVSLKDRPCLDLPAGAYNLQGGVSHWYVKDTKSKKGNWWAQGGSPIENVAPALLTSPDAFEVVAGKENVVEVNFSEEPCGIQNTKKGNLVLTVNTNGNGMTYYDISVGSERKTGTGKWGDGRQITLSGIPAGMQALGANSCMGDFGGPEYTKGIVGISPSMVTIPENGTAYASLDCNQGGTQKTQVTVVWEAKGCSAAKGGVILGANKYSIKFGEEASGSVTQEVAPGNYLVVANIGVRENSGNQLGEWKVPGDHSVSPTYLTVKKGQTSTVTIKTSCDGGSVDQKGSVTLNWSAEGCAGYKGSVSIGSSTCSFGDGATGTKNCGEIAPGTYNLTHSSTQVRTKGSDSDPSTQQWKVPPKPQTLSPKTLTVKSGQSNSISITTSCDGSSTQCTPVPVTVDLSIQNTGGVDINNPGGGFKVVGSASISSASITDISVSVSGSVVFATSNTGSNMNGKEIVSGTLRIPVGQKTSSQVDMTKVISGTPGQIMATAKATPENCVSGVTVNQQQITKPPSATSQCTFTYRVFSTGTEYNGFAGQVIYSLSCSGKGRFSSGNTIKVNLPCKSDVVSINLGGKTGDEIGSTGILQTALYEKCLPQSCIGYPSTCATVNVNGKESTWVKVNYNG